MNNNEFKFWLDTKLVPDVLEGVSKETLISSYLPVLLNNSLIVSEKRRVSQVDRRRPPPRRRRKVEEKEDLLNLLFYSEIKDPLMEIALQILNEEQINKIKFTQKIYDGYDIMETGAKVGSIEMIEYASSKQGDKCDKSICNIAVEYGQLAILRYLHENNCPCDDKIMGIAVEYGQLEILEYLHETYHYPYEDKFYQKETLCDIAVRYNQLEILEFLIEEGVRYNKKICNVAVQFGYLEILKFLIKKGIHCNERICDVAAKSGQVEVLKYLYKYGFVCDRKTFREGAWYGKIKVLRYLDEIGIERSIEDNDWYNRYLKASSNP